MRRTKIVCTLGPASQDEETLRQLLRAGMDVARLNFSHATHEEATGTIALVRRLAEEEGRVVAILQDLQGPRLRIGDLNGGQADLLPGVEFTLTNRDLLGNERGASVNYPGLTQDIGPGDTLLLNDGAIELKVGSATATDLVCRVSRGGLLKKRSGINVPNVTLNLPPITEKDERDVAFGVKERVDYIAMSFLRRGEDVALLKGLLQEQGADIPIIAKIETLQAVRSFDDILSACRGVMIARGDLGIEMPSEEVPLLQKRLIEKTRAAGKPVITATQMLESMVHHPQPTRAEASDVANAILDGTDALMLSSETSIGAYPVEAVKTAVRIALTTEKALPYREYVTRAASEVAGTVTDAISQATCEVAYELGARAILTATVSGYTARMVAKHRPLTPVVAVTTSPTTQAQLALVWGVLPLLGNRHSNIDEMISSSIQLARKRGLVAPGDLVVITSGVPLGRAGQTNLLEVHSVEEGG